jgi:class 3 adenylate cyclase
VSSLFPEAVKKQLMESQGKDQLSDDTLPKGRLMTFLNDGSKNDNAFYAKRGESDDYGIESAKQIAELFPETTIMFADISGFTAWASSREPSHVFTLLENLYGAFDHQARRMGEYGGFGWCNHSFSCGFEQLNFVITFTIFTGIFKVETIGDSYMAVCGLPEPNRHHALQMAKFASLCIEEMAIITKRLELSLGPGTADLALRLGLHSGPTIAGVLRGERARFQLFGDTVSNLTQKGFF